MDAFLLLQMSDVGARKKTVASHGSFVMCIIATTVPASRGAMCEQWPQCQALSLSLSRTDYNAGQVITEPALTLFVLICSLSLLPHPGNIARQI